MDISHDKNDKQALHRKPTIQFIVLLVCILILFSVGIFKGRYQTLSANGVATTGLELNQLKEGEQTRELIQTARSTDSLAYTPSIWPINGAVTSGFGWRNSPLEGGSELHDGIDIANNMGTPVVATADGEVVKTGLSGGYGNIVQINHGNGIDTIYGHNSQIAVKVGQSVRKGQVISYVGSTGKSTGPHLHYEVRVNGKAVDPIKFLVRY